MILDSFTTTATDLTPNVCNRITDREEPSDETKHRSSSLSSSLSSPPPPPPPPLLTRFNINTKLSSSPISFSILNSPDSISGEEGSMMDKSSRSSSVSSDIDDGEAETASIHSSATANFSASKKGSPAGTNFNDAGRTEPANNQMSGKTCDSKPEFNVADDIKRLESIIQSLKDSTTSEISQLREMVTQKDKIIFDLTEKLDQQRDYDDIKRELTIVRSELSHFGPVVSALDAAAVAAASVNHPNSNTTTTANNNNSSSSKNGHNNHHSSSSFNNTSGGQQPSLVHRNPLFVPFQFSQLQSLGNVESFGSILGEEIANTYAKAMAAAAVASSNNNNNNSDSSNNNHNNNNDNNLKSNANVNLSNSNQNNGNNTNNPAESQSPSQTSNGGDAGADDEQKSRESASATPTSAMMFCPEVVEPLLTGSPLGSSTMPTATAAAAAAAVTDLGQLNQIANSYSSPSHHLFYEKLQHQLRCNVEKYMNETLNTLQISRYVRELLSVHNIGQRLFAKYVLGLSQGTVSELLSKPKPWDKLTEKGRDSYRKMHAWSTDERCINLLKMMVPRKEYGSYLGKETNPYKQDDSATEERIAQILNEAHRSGKVGSMAGARPELLAHHFMNGDPIAAKLDLMKDLKNNCNMNNDATSDNGSDDDKSDSCAQINERKSPLNPTAIATISNFYRNMNSESDSRNNSRTLARSNKFMDGIDAADQANQQAGLISLYQDHLTKLIGQQMEEFRGGSQNCDEISPFLLQAYPDLFARLISSGMLNGAHYLPGLGLDSSQHATPLENLRKSSRIESPQSLRDQRDSAEPRLKIDSILGQLKSESAQSPSHNGQNTLQSINNANSAGANVFNNGDSDDLAASPLQRMQSITNSLLSQTSLPSLPSQPSRPAKAVLPPITQQQFDQYNNLNTEDIVKRVKEQLSQYSISQRLFGESVLGLSQGSVSDLLARPKPWHMLTQKGREPFIRMKMFLEDDNAIHKLVASQYKIAPEKLMRTGNFVSGAGIPPGLAGLNTGSQLSQSQLPGSPGALSINTLNVGSGNSNNNNGKNNNNNGNNVKPSPASSSDQMLKYEQSMSPSSVENSIRSNTSSPDMLSSSSVNNVATTMASVPSPLSSMRMSRMSAAAFNQINNNNSNNCNNLSRPARNTTPITPNSIQQSAAAAAAAAYMQPSVYELAALTSDLDTQIITTRIKETLMAHNIGQKIFGEVVLGLSQGSVSELLSKPKPWHMLSIKGREPFIRMQLWLNDANNIDKLQTLKNERREANKRRRTHLDEGLSSFKPFDNQLFNFSNSFHSLNHQLGKSLAAASPGGSFPLSTTNAQPVVKKARILFTEEQKEALRIAFAMDPYPSSATAEFLAKELNLSIRTITNWFHNHRMRLKQINSSANNQEESSNPAANYNLGRDSVLFDQSKFRSLLTQRLADLKLRSNNLQHSNNSNHGSSNNDNSNQFGSFGQSSPPTHHGRMKYSPSMFHQTQSMYSNNTNSCSSPASSSSFQEEEDMGTLDLSMTSHNPQFRISPDKLDSTGRSSMHDDSDDGLRTGEEDDEQMDSGDEQPPPPPPPAAAAATQQQPDAKPTTVQHQQRKQHRSGSSRRKPQNVMSSSSRRKAAQPQQWVAPVVATPDFGDEDDYIEDEDDFADVDVFRQQSNKSSEMNGDGGGGAIYDQQIKNKIDSGSGDDLEDMDNKTDEDDNVDDDDDDDDDGDDVEHRNLNGTLPPPHKKLKSSANASAAASKLGLKDQDDSAATIIQGCVQ